MENFNQIESDLLNKVKNSKVTKWFKKKLWTQ